MQFLKLCALLTALSQMQFLASRRSYLVFWKTKTGFLAVAWDMKGPTFRHLEFKEYKGTRAKTDDSLIAQFPLVYGLLDLMRVPCFKKPP